ncbi:MAG: peptidoglycan DD-metalloendopeptidase family protein [Gammaproteobacteria bacterium]|nr:peptidoglycan DD-metalloendopeptidase family protein [Gammaproteobacteria bacterium]
MTYLSDFIHLSRFFLLATILFGSFCFASTDTSQQQRKLDQIRENINQVESSLEKDKSKRGELQRELKALDIKIAKLSNDIKSTNQQIGKYKKSLKSLNKELKSLEHSLKSHKQALSRQIKTAYMMGRSETAKLLLNQQNAIEMGHAVIYYRYLNKTRSHQILEYNLLLQEKMTIKNKITQESEQVAELQKSQFMQKNRFSANRSRRNKLISLLNNKIISNEDTLASLQTHRSKIESLLISLGEVLADIPSKPADVKDFLTQKGQLPWPVKGRITNEYGSKKARSDLKWNGVVLALDYGKPVHAVNSGRVIFSDWLQGYGFIIIIDHGASYMSLYGYNQNLLKETGDWVKQGEIIASVGDSGGQDSSGLYFEIRQQGKPVDPTKWCSFKYTNYASL